MAVYAVVIMYEPFNDFASSKILFVCSDVNSIFINLTQCQQSLTEP